MYDRTSRKSVTLIVMATAVFTLGSVAAFQASPSKAASKVCASKSGSPIADPVARQKSAAAAYVAAGWTLTAAGKAMAQGRYTPQAAATAAKVQNGTGANLGETAADVIVAVTNDASAVTPGAGAVTTRRLQSVRRASGSTLVLLNCGYGQQGNINWTSGYGWSYTAWEVEAIDGSFAEHDGPSDYCGYSKCGHYSTYQANGSHKVFSGEPTEQYYTPAIGPSYCS